MKDQSQRQYQFALRTIIFLVVGFLFAVPAFAATICGYNDTSGKLSTVVASCKVNGEAGEYNISGNTTYFSSSGINFSCPNAFCWAKQGTGLCEAVARVEGKTGTYVCTNAANCSGEPLGQSAGSAGAFVCGENKSCCLMKIASVDSSNSSPSSLTVPDPLGGATIPGLIGNIIRMFAGIAGSIALVVFVIGGFQYILSGGEQAKVKSATQMLRNGAIGIILIFGAYFLTNTIMNLILIKTP
jgi:hypothetical protein